MKRASRPKSRAIALTLTAALAIAGACIPGLAKEATGHMATSGASPMASDDELPKPDFSAMEKWYEVSSVSHDVFAAKMTYVVKAKKEESRPVKFYMQFLNADGTVLKESYMLALNAWFSGGNTPAEPIKVELDTPKESDLSKVKAVKVVRYKE